MNSIRMAFLFALSTISALPFAYGESDYVTVEVPTSCRKKPGSFYIGDMLIQLSSASVDDKDACWETKDLDKALYEYPSDFNNFFLSQVNEGISTSVANANMAKWSQYMQAVFMEGIARQMSADLKKQQDAMQGIEEMTEDVRAQIAELGSEAAERASALTVSYATAAGTVQGKLAVCAGAVSSAIAAAKKEVKDQLEKVREGGSSEEIAEAKRKAVEAATKVAELEKRLDDFDFDKAREIVNEFAIMKTEATNNWNAVSRWLGYTNDLSGTFSKPRNPKTGSKYEESSDINDYLGDVGVIAFVSAEDMERESPISMKYRYLFADQVRAEEGSNQTTNTIANFTAVANWADGASIICTNGVYSMHPQYQFVTNIIWATNWTDAVTHITRNETTNIVRVVTNLVTHYDSITTQVHKVEVFTNWNEMVQWTTNVTMNIISNQESYVNITTNLINNEFFVTNFIQQSVGFTNWHDVYHVTTNEVKCISNFVYGIQRILGMPEIVNPTSTDPKDNPYSPEYEGGSEVWTNSVFYKYHDVTNAISRITNEFTKAVALTNALDGVSVWTNAYDQIEIKGYDETGRFTMSTNEYVRYVPLKRVKYDDVTREAVESEFVWSEYADSDGTALYILTNDIEVVKRFIKNYSESTTINMLVTNAERFAEMRTNFFGQVGPESILDNASVWTNGERKIEVKGFGAADRNTFFVKDEFDDNSGRWVNMPTVDSDAFLETPPAYLQVNAHRSVSMLKSSDFSEGQYPFNYPTNNIISLYGYVGAATGTTPMKMRKVGIESLYTWDELSWEQYYKPDLSSITTNAQYGTENGSKLEIAGFANASVGQVPAKSANGLEWRDASAYVSIVDTDGTAFVATNGIVFASAADSNVEVKGSYTNDGKVKLTIGVYYK